MSRQPPFLPRSALLALLAAALPSALLPALLPSPAHACSVCGCDPSGGALGLERPSAGDLRLAVEGRYLQKESGPAGESEGEKEGRTTLRVQFSPIQRLSATFDLPVYAFKDHYNADGVKDDASKGLGDVQFGLRYEFLHLGGFIPAHTFALGIQLKAPSGDNKHVAAGDDAPDEHKQLGSGTWDYFPGVSWAWNLAPATVYASAQARINGTNSRGFRYGNALFGTLGARYAFFESRSLFVSLEAQGRNAGYDHNPDGTLDDSSGGFVGYATVGAGLEIASAFVVRGTLQLPVVTSLNGQQSEHPVGFVGLAYDWSL